MCAKMDSHLEQVFWICLPLAAQVAIPISLGYLSDHRLPPTNRGVRWAKLKQHPKLFSLAVLMAFGAMGQAVVNFTMTKNPAAQLTYSLTVSVLMCSMAFWALPGILARANLFLFLDSMVYIQIGGALDYWFTAEDACVPGGVYFLCADQGLLGCVPSQLCRKDLSLTSLSDGYRRP